MRRHTRSVLCVLTVVTAGVAQAGDWPSLRGPRSDGSAAGGGAFAEPTALELAWRQTIGPGYSGVTVAAGRAVSAFSDGTHDVVVAWSVSDGREIWRTEIGETYRGHDGSTDGPVGTATLTDGGVYFVGPHGDLLALSADSGEILWKKNLTSEWDAPAPTYGFANVPWATVGFCGVTVIPTSRATIPPTRRSNLSTAGCF